jgi:hypothetical protein
MINADQFYSRDDMPDRATQNRIWQKIRKKIHPEKHSLLLIPDRRSFLYGVAASLILYLTGVGMFHEISNALERSQPADVRLDRAYTTAIKEFERVVPIATPAVKESQQTIGRKKILEEQLQLIDQAIGEIRLETNHSDYSSIKRARLRELYSMKLQVLQRMVEEGDIEL